MASLSFVVTLVLVVILSAVINWSINERFQVVSSQQHEYDSLIDFDGNFNKIGITATEAVRARGFQAKDHYFKTKDGYVLNIVHCWNPVIKKKSANLEPVLFVHGVYTSAAFFVLNSARVRPKDLSEIFAKHPDLCKFSAKQLKHKLKNEESIKNLTFLLLNMGYDVWLLNRRGYQQSENKDGHLNRTIEQVIQVIPKPFLAAELADLGASNISQSFRKTGRSVRGLSEKPLVNMAAEMIKKSLILNRQSLDDVIRDDPKQFKHTFDADYWSFSVDQQADYDIPQAIKFVLSRSNREKLIYVGHSLGGALGLLSLSEYEYLHRKSKFESE